MVALTGSDVAHFYMALVLLALGWNFGFIGATAMMAQCPAPLERNRVQCANDFFVFRTIAADSFLADSLLSSSGWQAINWLVLPVVGFVLVSLVWRAARPLGTMPAPSS